MPADAFIQCRVTPEMKALVSALAERERITESALVRELLQVVLRTAALQGFPKLGELDAGSNCGSSGKCGRTRYTQLRRRDISAKLAAKTAASAHGPWRLAACPALCYSLPNAYFVSLGLPSLAPSAQLNPPNRRMRTRMSGGVAAARG